MNPHWWKRRVGKYYFSVFVRHCAKNVSFTRSHLALAKAMGGRGSLINELVYLDESKSLAQVHATCKLTKPAFESRTISKVGPL